MFLSVWNRRIRHRQHCGLRPCSDWDSHDRCHLLWPICCRPVSEISQDIWSAWIYRRGSTVTAATRPPVVLASASPDAVWEI